jgi:gliding motility-associatede transport system auxiliary component
VEDLMRRVEGWGYAGLIALALAILLRVLVIGSGTPALVLAVLGGLLLLVYFVRAGQSVDTFLSRRSTRAGGTVLGTTLFVVGTALLVNAIASRVGARVDLTADRIFTVAPETRAALKAAPVAPEVWVFYPDNSGPAEAWRTLLEGAQAADPRLRFHIVDPAREPIQTVRFDLRTYATVVTVGDRFETVAGVDEESFLSALLRASRRERPEIGFLEGHGERSMSGGRPEELRSAALALDKRGYSPKNLDLLRGDRLDSVAVVVIACPETPLSVVEIDTLRAFQRRGGRLFIALDPASSMTMSELVEPAGLRFAPAFVSDPDQRDPELLYLEDYTSHMVVKVLDERRIQVLFAGAGAIDLVKQGTSWKQASLILSGRRSRVAGAPDSEPRSRVVAAAAEQPEGHPPARLLLFGDVDFFTNRYFDAIGNGDLFLGAIEWLSDREQTIALRPRTRTNRPVVLSRQQGRALMVVMAGLLPLGVAGAGFVTLWRRR